MSMTNLVAACQKAAYEFPSLKAITLAQWMLESGRGSSVLAVKYKNFGGLKYREELQNKVVGVSKIFYDEGRGEDDKYYFACETEAAFVNLYWAFIARAPYKGWQAAAQKSPLAYLTFIVNAGYVGGNQAHKDWYINTVSGLYAEAEALLKSQTTGETNMSLKGIKIALDCGHGFHDGGVNDGGAPGVHGTNERDENSFYAGEAAKLLRAMGATVSVFDYSKDGTLKLTLGQKGARAAGHSLFVSCHLNSFTSGSAQGTEVLYENKATVAARAFAKTLQKSLVTALGYNDRGTKPKGLGVLQGVPASVMAAVLCEPFFISGSNFKSAAEVRAASGRAAVGLANGIAAYCKEAGLTSTTPTPVDPKPTEPVTPAPTGPAKSLGMHLRYVRIAGKDALGFQRGELQLCETFSNSTFVIRDRVSARSGLLGYQTFRVAAESKAQSHEPIPEGYYKLGPVEWASGANNYNASWKQGIGATWVDCLPLMPTGRSAIGIHLDAGVAGTEGCVGVLTVADEKKVVGWMKTYGPSKLHVNYGFGTVDTKIKLVEKAPSEEVTKPAEPVTPAPVEPTKPPVETDTRSWFKKFWEALKNFIDGWF